MNQQKANYDRRRDVRQRKPLRRGDVVFTDQRKRGTVQSATESPRSYLVDTDSDTLRRNGFHLTTMPGSEDTDKSAAPDIGSTEYTTRSGRVVKPVNRLQFKRGEMCC